MIYELGLRIDDARHFVRRFTVGENDVWCDDESDYVFPISYCQAVSYWNSYLTRGWKIHGPDLREDPRTLEVPSETSR